MMSRGDMDMKSFQCLGFGGKFAKPILYDSIYELSLSNPISDPVSNRLATSSAPSPNFMCSKKFNIVQPGTAKSHGFEIDWTKSDKNPFLYWVTRIRITKICEYLR